MEVQVPESDHFVEPGHKQQQSHDSGAYIDWASDEHSACAIPEPKFASNVTGEFVTVVAVEPASLPSPFVTVLAIGDEQTKGQDSTMGAEEVLVYRLPGERLGFGLKFEGGLKTAERVSRLFIQSCAPDSPASRTRASWGPLSAGDEVLEIDGLPVSDMTRIDCVRALKESNVVIKLNVKPYPENNSVPKTDNSEETSVPPPIPPRKIPRRSTTGKDTNVNIVCPPDGFADSDNCGSVPVSRASSTNKSSASPKVNRHVTGTDTVSICSSNGVPEAEVYLDLLGQEGEFLPGESESDDTGSSISTVVDRLSSNSSFSDVRSVTSMDITTPPTPTNINGSCPTFDLDRVLEPFLQLEREFSSSATIVENSLFSKLVALTEPQTHNNLTRTSSGANENDESALQPPENFKDNPHNDAKENEQHNENRIVMKATPRTLLGVFCGSSNDGDKCDRGPNDKDIPAAPALPPKPTPRKDINQKFKSGKKRPPPPPPPPRSGRPICPNPPNANKDHEADPEDGDDNISCDLLSDHLPRLIDFVPKDRTDLVVPNAIHADQNPLDLLLQRQHLMQLINGHSQSEDAIDHTTQHIQVEQQFKVPDAHSLQTICTKSTAAFDPLQPIAEICDQQTVVVIDSSPTDDVTDLHQNMNDSDLVVDNNQVSVIHEQQVKHEEEEEEEEEPAVEEEEEEEKEGKQVNNVEDDLLNDDVVDNVANSPTPPTVDFVPIASPITVSICDDDNKERTVEKESENLEPKSGSSHNIEGNVVKPLPRCRPTPTDIPSSPTPPVVSRCTPTPVDGVPRPSVDNADAGTQGAMETASVELSIVDVTLDLSPPPSFSRLPPDGHEFPPNYQETCPPDIDLSSVITKSILPEPDPKSPPPLPNSARPIIGKQFSLNNDSEPFKKSSPITEEIVSSTKPRSGCWRNDEKSEKSVRDKIAMFSNVNDQSPVLPSVQPAAIRKLNRFKSSEDVFSENSFMIPAKRNLSRSVMSVDKLVSCSSFLTDSDNQNNNRLSSNSMTDVNRMPSTDLLNCVDRAKSSMDLALSLSSCSSSAYSSCSPESSLSPTVSPSYAIGNSSTLPRKHAAKTERKTSLTSTRPPSLINNKSNIGISRTTSFTVGNSLHSRSQSLIDVSPNLNGGSSTINRSNNEEARRRASLNALIEQRRRSISKLRGLVIPEKVSEIPTVQQTIIDLPEIKSKDSVSVIPSNKNFVANVYNSIVNNNNKNNTNNARNCSLNLYNRTATARTTGNNSSPISSGNKEINSCQNVMVSPPWKSESTTCTDLPKYSPAFKRKSLALYGNPSSTSSVSSSLSSSREELRPYFDEENNNKLSKQFTTTNRRLNKNITVSEEVSSWTASNVEPPKSLESITSPTMSDVSFEFIATCRSTSSPDPNLISSSVIQPQKRDSKIGNVNDRKNIRSLTDYNKTTNSSNDHARGEGEESDDSAVSSSRSSTISHEFSPPASPVLRTLDTDEDHLASSGSERQCLLASPSNSSSSSGDRRTLRRTLSSETTESAASSTGSTLTSGSQASCSSSGSDSVSRRVLKAQSVEAINRKNVLSSAKYSSGQDLKVGPHTLIRRKFDDTDPGAKNEDDSEDGPSLSDFIDELNRQLSKDDPTNDITNESENEESMIRYRLSSLTDQTSAKIAYIDTESNDSLENGFDDSTGSEGTDFEYVSNMERNYTNNDDVIYDTKIEKCDNNSKIISQKVNDKGLSGEKVDKCKTLTKETTNSDSNHIVSDRPNCVNMCKDNQKINLTTASENSDTVKSPLVKTDKNLTKVCNKSKHNNNSSDRNLNLDEVDMKTNKTKENCSSVKSVGSQPIRNINGKVSDLKNSFEKSETTVSYLCGTSRANKSFPPFSSNSLSGSSSLSHIHARVSSLDSTASEDSCTPTPTQYGSVTNLQKEQQFGSITSLASSTSLISQQELQQLIDDANQTLEETTTSTPGGNNGGANCSHEVSVVILHRDTSGGSVGITLAGGADYEAKEITVHKVLIGSPADRDGRIQKGDRILSINGRSMKGITHRESLAILKAPRPEVVLVVSRWRPEGQQFDSQTQEDPLVATLRNNLRPPRIPEQPSCDTDISSSTSPLASPLSRQSPLEKDESSSGAVGNGTNNGWGAPVSVCLVKDGAGLGFSLEGGKDSPFGDMPLTIKKIFTGGCAEKSKELFAGDELLAVNGTDVTSMSRIEAWSLMKRIADGQVKLILRHKNNTHH